MTNYAKRCETSFQRPSLARVDPSKFIRNGLVRGSLGSLAVRIGALLVGLILSIVLARSLGPAGFGTYSLAYAAIILIAIPTQLGLPQLVVRETAAASELEDWGLMRGLWRWCNATVLGFSVGVTALAIFALAILDERIGQDTRQTLLYGLFLVPLIALGSIRGAALRGLRRVVSGQIPDTVLRPALFASFLILSVFALPRGSLTPEFAMLTHAIAALIAFATGAILLKRAEPNQLRTNPPPEYRSNAWLRSALPLAFIGGLNLIQQQTDTLMLGFFRPPESVGIYRVAVTGSTLGAFGLAAISMVVGQHFSRLYATGATQELQKIATLSARGALLVAVPTALVLIAFGNQILEIAFGQEYVPAHLPLSILIFGQVVASSVGTAAALLNMTGHEHATLRSIAVATIANVSLNALLIPAYGATGAAIATTISIACANLLLWQAALRRLRIDTMAFSFVRAHST